MKISPTLSDLDWLALLCVFGVFLDCSDSTKSKITNKTDQTKQW